MSHLNRLILRWAASRYNVSPKIPENVPLSCSISINYSGVNEGGKHGWCLAFLCRVGKGISSYLVYLWGHLSEKHHHPLALSQTNLCWPQLWGESQAQHTCTWQSKNQTFTPSPWFYIQFSGIELTQACNLLKLLLQIYYMCIDLCLWNCYLYSFKQARKY